MALSSRAKHLLALCGCLLLGALSPSLARAQQTIQLSDSLRAATEELRVRRRTFSSGMWNDRFGDYFVLSREGGSVRASQDTRGPLLDRREVRVVREAFRYAVRGRDSTRVGVTVQRTARTELRRPIAIGARIEGPEDTVETVESASAVIVFEQDTAAAWTVTMSDRYGTDVPKEDRFVGTITSGARTIRLVPVWGSPPPKPRRGLRGLLDSGGFAYGFVFEEAGRDIAAVQFYAYPPSERVWMPKSATARERVEFAAMFTAVLRIATTATFSSPPRVSPAP